MRHTIHLPLLLAVLLSVRAGAQLLVVPCNSASYYLAPVREAVAVPILDRWV